MQKAAALALTLLPALGGAAILAPPALPFPALAGAAIAPFDSGLQIEAAQHLILSETPGGLALAGSFARRSIAAMPYNQPALSLVTQARLATDEIRSTNLAAALGWRDPLANARLIRQAVAENSPLIAAQRVDALGRSQGGSFAATAADRVMAMPGGPEALAQRAALRSGSQWWITYLRIAASNEKAAAGRLDFARAIESNDRSWRRRIVGAIASSMSGEASTGRSFDLWRDTIAEPAGMGTVLYDENFSRFAPVGQRLGGEWRIRPRAPYTAERDGEGITLSANSNRGGAVIEQQFLPSPGAFRLRAKGLDTEMPLFWRIQCQAAGTIFESTGLVGNWRLDIPAACGAATLQLVAADGAEIGTRAGLTRVALERSK